MLFMVIEHFLPGRAPEVYRRFRDRGRMAPDGLRYIASWVDLNFERCFQVMEADSEALFREWTANWDDVIDFEIEDIVPFGIETGEPVRFAGMFHPVASDLTIAEATRSRINAFGIEYEGKTGLSTSEFSWAA